MKFELRPDVAVIIDDSGNEEKVVDEVSSEALASAYYSKGRTELGLLPPAVRWVSTDGLGIILERPPQQVSMSYRETEYIIPLPWTVYGIRLKDLTTVDQAFVFGRPYPLAGMGDELYSLPLPGIGDVDDIELNITLPRSHELAEGLMQAVQKFWTRPRENVKLSTSETLPEEWKKTYEDSVANGDLSKYLTFLQGFELHDMNFQPLVRSDASPDLSSVTSVLERPTEGEPPKTIIEYFSNLFKLAQ